MSAAPSKITKSERTLLRQLAEEAWNAELSRYANLDPAISVARAIAFGFVEEEVLGESLMRKMNSQGGIPVAVSDLEQRTAKNPLLGAS